MTNVLHFDEKSKAACDAKRTDRLWKELEENRACWEDLAHGAKHNSRFDPRGSVAAVYAYGAYAMRRIKRKSVDALFLKEATEDAAREQILVELEKLQTECESAAQARAVTRGVSYAINACLHAVNQMRVSAGGAARVDCKVTMVGTKGVMPAPKRLGSRKKAAKRKKATAKKKR